MSLERIEITPFAVIVGELLQNRRTGTLTLLRGTQRTVLYWSQGEIVLIASPSPTDSLAEFVVRRGLMTHDRAVHLAHGDPTEVVERFHAEGIAELSARQTLLREWLASLYIPLFSLDEGTAAFTDEEALEPEKRVFVQSTAALTLEGIRAITNGLVLRRSLGDLKREIEISRSSRFSIDAVPLSEHERRIASSLTEPQTIETFLKRFPQDSVAAARVAIGMLALGIYGNVEVRSAQSEASLGDMQRDLELLAAIGSSDQRSLRAVALSRQLGTLDHYQVVDVPRAATRAKILSAAEEMRRRYEPATYPPIVRDALLAIGRRIDEAVTVLTDPNRRAAYDKLIQQSGPRTEGSIQQRVTQHSIAQQNFTKAKHLTIDGDYYGAIVLLKQAVQYAPDHADAWFLLGSCQERNPKWRRDAAESFQMALSIDPNMVDALISLGDLYKLEGMISRAQTCYEDVLKITPDNQQAKSRLAALKKK